MGELDMIKKSVICLICSLVFLWLPLTGFCETKEIIAEGEYVMGDGETMAVAEERALKEATRNAAETAGAFVKSYTIVKNMALEEDVIEVVANHSMKIVVLDQKRTLVGDAVKFYCKIKSIVTTEEIEANLKKVGEDSRIVASYNRLKADYDKQAQELDELKTKLAVVRGEDKKVLLVKIKDEENAFKVNLLLEKGERSIFDVDFLGAIDSFTSAIALDPDFAESYARRAVVYKEVGEEKKAYEDAVRAIAIEPDNPRYYFVRSGTYQKGCSSSEQYDCSKALKDLEKAIELDPKKPLFYLARANTYLLVNKVDAAIDDLNKATALGRKEEWPWMLALAYLTKAGLAKEKNDNYAALADLTSAITITTNSKYYNNTLRKLSDILRDARNKNYTQKQLNAVFVKSFNLDVNNEKDLYKLRNHADSLRFIANIYRNRADIYRDLGYKEKAERDIKSASDILPEND